MTRTLVIGASFGGLEFLYRTARQRRRRFASHEMTVIDPRGTHAYIPLVHEVVSGALTPNDVQFDTARFCSSVGATFIAQRVTTIDRAQRLVTLHDGTTVPYDRLVISTGSVPDVPLGLVACDTVFAAKFLDEALRLRARILAIRAVRTDPVHAVVVGGGITSVEWSAELAGRGVNGHRVPVTLITRESRLLAEFAPNVARHAEKRLQRLGVKIQYAQTATALQHGQIVTADGTVLPGDVVVWAAGVRAANMQTTHDAPIVVDTRLTTPDDTAVAAVGDVVRIVDQDRTLRPAVRAIEAIWQGAYLARHPTQPYRPHGPFFFGLSLGPGHSMLIYRRWWLDLPFFVGFRRFLKWGYYARFRLITHVLRS